MFCNCLLGTKPGFMTPGQITHGIGECCMDFAVNVWSKMRGLSK